MQNLKIKTDEIRRKNYFLSAITFNKFYILFLLSNKIADKIIKRNFSKKNEKKIIFS